MAKIESTGLAQGDLVTFLTNVMNAVNELKTDLNALNAKLDLDASVNDTNYAASCNATFAALTLSV